MSTKIHAVRSPFSVRIIGAAGEMRRSQSSPSVARAPVGVATTIAWSAGTSSRNSRAKRTESG